MVGILEKSLYGTRDAANNSQKEISRFMKRNEFDQGKYNPCTYYHKTRGIKVMVHGDDFVSTGERESMKWCKKRLEDRFEIKTTVIGQGKGEVQ